MGAAPKKKPYEYPSHPSQKKPDAQESLRSVKMEAEKLREKLQSSVLDNPKLSQKAARIISLWVQSQKKK